MTKPDPEFSSPPQNAAERVVCAYPARLLGPIEDIELLAVWNALVRDRWIVIVLSLLGLAGGAAYTWITPSWYRAEVRLLPEALGGRPLPGTQSTQLGEIAGLAWAAVDRDMKNQTIALAGSRDFLRGFLSGEGLVEAVCALDGANPDPETAAGIFAGRMVSIREDQQTGVLTLSVNWKDAATAADVANRLAAGINRFSRNRAVAEATTNIGFLRGQFAESQDAQLREASGRLLEVELQKLLVAKGRQDYAFRILDSARPPAGRNKPRFLLVAGGALVSGLMLALAVVLVRSVARRPGQ